MKKKHDDGYVLVYVLVVITVLCLIAVSLLSISLRNMQSQTAEIKRMQDKYAAQGEIEKVVANMNSEKTLEVPSGSDIANIILTYVDTVKAVSNALEVEIIASSTSGETNDLNYHITLKMVSEKKNICVECELKLDLKIEKVSDTSYTITPSNITYNAYQISTVDVEGGDGE